MTYEVVVAEKCGWIVLRSDGKAAGLQLRDGKRTLRWVDPAKSPKVVGGSHRQAVLLALMLAENARLSSLVG